MRVDFRLQSLSEQSSKLWSIPLQQFEISPLYCHKHQTCLLDCSIFRIVHTALPFPLASCNVCLYQSRNGKTCNKQTATIRDLKPLASNKVFPWRLHNEIHYQVTVMLKVNLHNSISKGCSVQRNRNVPFVGFDPRITVIKQECLVFTFQTSDQYHNEKSNIGI
jgi:hypothetical protein